ncbi:Armadillo-type fold containing protein [Senna tora]|uniref:Armadillo-type fold containing protein n=1 Tax=Senna tora TaxID=362788 RepID=A0A834WBJ1_9FABA|nr:Armadillo-type fold containing protein [Senna tora]
MATSSVGDSSGKQYLRYKNAHCNCRKVARIRVSHSDANPNRLYVCCENDECNFFRWLKPMKDVEVSSEGGIKMAATNTTTSLYVQRTSKMGSEVKLKDDFMMVKEPTLENLPAVHPLNLQAKQEKGHVMVIAIVIIPSSNATEINIRRASTRLSPEYAEK